MATLMPTAIVLGMVQRVMGLGCMWSVVVQQVLNTKRMSFGSKSVKQLMIFHWMILPLKHRGVHVWKMHAIETKLFGSVAKHNDTTIGAYGDRPWFQIIRVWWRYRWFCGRPRNIFVWCRQLCLDQNSVRQSSNLCGFCLIFGFCMYCNGVTAHWCFFSFPNVSVGRKVQSHPVGTIIRRVWRVVV